MDRQRQGHTLTGSYKYYATRVSSTERGKHKGGEKDVVRRVKREGKREGEGETS
jgi:hypothetical protein